MLIIIHDLYKSMKEITVDEGLIAFCGLYCGACQAYLKEKCPGCAKNEKASWCKIRSCCGEKKIRSCADCNEFKNQSDCKKFNNIVSKMFALIFRSDRAACLRQIKEKGYAEHARQMAEGKAHTIKK
jgi:hypothetical protein